MCGITAYVGIDDATETILYSLQNLEYRGYDSAGIALLNGTGIQVTKSKGEVEYVKNKVSTERISGTVGIGHTRWSTHGKPSEANAHPHTDCSGQVAVVHNGIIDNHDDLRSELVERGHVFTSETDTEVVPHLVGEQLQEHSNVALAFRSAIDRLDGSFSIAMIVEGTERVFAARNGSPLILGIGSDQNFLASDIPAFLEFTDQVIYLEEGDIAEISARGYRITDINGNSRDRPIETINWAPEATEKAGYDHFMLKEIQEQPTSLRQSIEGRVRDGELILEEFPTNAFSDISSIHLVACGTSYHAGMYGERFIATWGVPASTYLASEYVGYPPPITDRTLVIGVTQSGETADTLEALRLARQHGARTLALTNVVGSTAARESDESLFIRAGPEIGVAATKTFSSQVATLLILGERIIRDITGEPTEDYHDRFAALETLPTYVQSVLQTSQADRIGSSYLGEGGHFFIGRGNAYSVALEGALKFKEITYLHAEGFAAGELKHGPLALVTNETPVFAICTGRDTKKMESNIREVQTRGAPVIAIAPRTSSDIVDISDDSLTVPATHPDLVPMLANVELQLIAYHAASKLGRSIDKPRNLAKSVTVE